MLLQRFWEKKPTYPSCCWLARSRIQEFLCLTKGIHRLPLIQMPSRYSKHSYTLYCHDLIRSPMQTNPMESSSFLPGKVSVSWPTRRVFLTIISPNSSPKTAKSLGRALSAWRQPGAVFKADPRDAACMMESSGGFSCDFRAHRRQRQGRDTEWPFRKQPKKQAPDRFLKMVIALDSDRMFFIPPHRWISELWI